MRKRPGDLSHRPSRITSTRANTSVACGSGCGLISFSACRNRTSEQRRGYPCSYRRRPSMSYCRLPGPWMPDRSRHNLLRTQKTADTRNDTDRGFAATDDDVGDFADLLVLLVADVEPYKLRRHEIGIRKNKKVWPFVPLLSQPLL